VNIPPFFKALFFSILKNQSYKVFKLLVNSLNVT